MNINQSLNPAQLKAVEYNEGPMLIVAGPGSGKTKVLTHKVAYLLENTPTTPEEILAITFTNKAAKEMRERVYTLLNKRIPWMGTFHSVCVRILRRSGENIGIPSNFVIYDDDDQKSLIRHIIKDLNLPAAKINPNAVLSSIGSAKNELIGPEKYKDLAYGYYQSLISQIYVEYQKRLTKNNALDFDDIIMKTVQLFFNNQSILEEYANKFKYVLIDEYQDTNHSQYIFSKLISGIKKNICAVGDMSQAIYSFRGADFRNILNFQKDYPDAKIFNLEQNYRSTKTILNAAQNVIKNNQTHIPLKIWTEKEPGDLITLYEAQNENEEALFVGTSIVEKVSNNLKPFNNFAVLYRTNAQSRNIEEMFMKLGVPYKLIGGLKFYKRKEIKDMISFLHVIENPKDTISWERIINVPPRGIGKKTLNQIKLSNWDLDVIEEISKLPIKYFMSLKEKTPPVQILEEVLDKTGYLENLNDNTDENYYRIENLKELRSVASQFVTLTDFLENIALVEAAEEPSQNGDSNAVSLMTIHSAKGLEFEEVYIIGMEEGLFPHSRSLYDKNELEEERRLCYVGITRAKEKLHISYAKNRLYLGSVNSNPVSRFIEEIPSELMIYKSHGKIQTIQVDRGLEDYLDNLEETRFNF